MKNRRFFIIKNIHTLILFVSAVLLFNSCIAEALNDQFGYTMKKVINSDGYTYYFDFQNSELKISKNDSESEADFSIPEFLEKNVKSIKIEEGITAIPDRAFENCSNVYDVALPYSIKKIGSNIFNSEKSQVMLELSCAYSERDNITIADDWAGENDVGALLFGTHLHVYFKGELGNYYKEPYFSNGFDRFSTADMGDNPVFDRYNYSEITPVWMGKNVTELSFDSKVTCIPSYAFSDTYTSNIYFIELPENLKYLGKECFAGQDNCMEIKLPSSLDYIVSFKNGNSVNNPFYNWDLGQTIKLPFGPDERADDNYKWVHAFNQADVRYSDGSSVDYSDFDGTWTQKRFYVDDVNKVISVYVESFGKKYSSIDLYEVTTVPVGTLVGHHNDESYNGYQIDVYINSPSISYFYYSGYYSGLDNLYKIRKIYLGDSFFRIDSMYLTAGNNYRYYTNEYHGYSQMIDYNSSYEAHPGIVIPSSVIYIAQDAFNTDLDCQIYLDWPSTDATERQLDGLEPLYQAGRLILYNDNVLWHPSSSS